MRMEDVTYDYVSGLIKSLLIFKPYYGYTLSRLERRIEYIPYKESRFGTMCVSAQDMRILVNADFIARTVDREFHMLAMEHEVCHISLRHFPRFELIRGDPEVTATEMHIVNIAMDIAINEIIGFPDEKGDFKFSTLSYARRMFREDLEPLMTAEWYYRKIMETDIVKDNIKDERAFLEALDKIIEGMSDHLRSVERAHGSCFEESKIRPIPSKLKEIMEEGARRQKTMERSRGVGKGESVLDFLPVEVDQYDKDIWKKLVDKHLGDELVADVDMMWGRPSRRREDSMWWNRHQTVAKTLYIGFDTSASVVCGDDRLVSRLLGYLSRGLRSNHCRATLILCDDGIQEVRIVRSIPMSKEFKIPGSGGTDLRKILDYIEANDKNPKMARLILFTDGQTPWRDSPVRTSVVYTPDHDKLKGDIMSWAVMRPTLED